MIANLRHLLLGLGVAAVALAGPGSARAADQAAAAAPAPAGKPAPPPQVALLRVTVGADGHVQTAKSLDPKTPAAVVQAATEIAAKLQFTPATKDGHAARSETSLSLTLGLVPRAGGYGMSLRRAQNGPNLVTSVWLVPNFSRDNGALVVVGVDLLADGSVDMKTFKTEKAELRVPSSFAEQRFVEATRAMLKDARFMLDTVDGVDVPAHISVPFSFNGGARRPDKAQGDAGDYGEYGERQAKAKGGEESRPSLTEVSRIEGITLPKIDFTAPAM